MGRDIGNLIGLQFSLIDEMLEMFKRQHLVAVKKSLGMGNMSGVFLLTEAGRNLAREHLENNQYAGPAPVPLYQYAEMVRLQKFKDNWLSPELLQQAFKHLVVEADILAQIGPAVNASKSFLIYGQPGNGKTASGGIAVPRGRPNPSTCPTRSNARATSSSFTILSITRKSRTRNSEAYRAYPTKLRTMAAGSSASGPFIITGGELTLEMLDLSFNKHSKVYDAPFQLKANNGIYLIDDFGRQKASPAEILNRWIVPMERHIDYLSFQAGGKMTVPFEAFLIFSTNLRPDQSGRRSFPAPHSVQNVPAQPEGSRVHPDLLALRRDRSIWNARPGLAESFVQKHYIEGDKRFRRCHPRDVVTHAIDILNFERRPMVLTEEVLDRAFHSCFVENVDVND